MRIQGKIWVTFVLAMCFAASDGGYAPAADGSGVESAQSWTKTLKPRDKEKLARLELSREKAVAEAGAGDPKSLREVKQVLKVEAQPVQPSDLPGRWRCRTFELGGMLPLNVTPTFECRIERDGSGFVLKKTSGSVRRLGRLDPVDDGSMLYYGAYVAQGDAPEFYPATDPYRDEVGVLFRLGADRLRLELPEPNASGQSHHDVIELVKAK
jgi:hypothetical protein